MRKALFIILAVCLTAPVWAGGLNRIDNSLGPEAGGLCGAASALSRGAATFYYNPANLVLTDSYYAEIGTDIVLPRFTIEHCGWEENSQSGKVHFLPLAGFIQPISDNVAWGVGITVPFGLGAQFAENYWSGFYQSEALIGLTNLTPALALRLNDEWSLGLGLNIGYGKFKYLAPFDVSGQFLPLMTDSEGDGFGLGGIVGLRYQPNDRLTCSLTYASESKVHLSGQTKIGRGPLSFTDDFQSSFTFPARADLGFSYQVSERLVVAGDINWYGYSHAVKSMTLDFSRLPLKKTNQLNWRDTYSVHLGGRYDLGHGWNISSGFGYMTAAVPTETMSQLTPDTPGWGAAIGLAHQGETFSYGLFANRGWGAKDVADNWRHRAPGLYRADIYTVGFSGSWRF